MLKTLARYREEGETPEFLRMMADGLAGDDPRVEHKRKLSPGKENV